MTDTIQEFDFTVDLLRAILWQYNEAVNLQSMLTQKSEWYEENQTQFWEDWYADVFNLATANDFGLTVWSIILGQPIVVVSAGTGRPAWGFGTFHPNFNRGNFSSTAGTAVRLPTEVARIALQIRYFQLTSAGTIPEINRMLKYVFKNYGPAWLVDNLDMTQVYKFNFELPSNLAYVFNAFDLLPRPAGVASSFVVV